MRWIVIASLILTLFSGCDSNIFETKEQKEARLLKERIEFEKKITALRELELKKLSIQTQKELAILESKKELAKINKEKELAKIKLQAELDKQKLALDLEKQKALFEQNMQQREQSYAMELKRYIVFLIVLFGVLISYFTFYYFKKKREDKLRAYNDNLERYFHHKENEARIRIAEKMLDTLASGKLDKEQESMLIGAFASGMKQQGQIEQTQTFQEQEKLLEDKNIEVIEQKSGV